MAIFDRPSELPLWCENNQTNCTDVPSGLSDAGFVQGSVPVAEYENSYRRNLGLWLGYLDQATTKQVLTSALTLDLRLVGGGNFTYTPANSTLAWDDVLYLSVPGIPQTSNAIAAGSVTLGDGTLAYVQANIPFTTPGSITSGDVNVQNVVSTSAISAGQSVSGAGIQSGTTVASVTDQTVTLSQAATATNQSASLTFVSSGPLTVQSTTTPSFTPAGSSVVIAIGLADSAIVGANSGQMRIRPLESRRLLGTGFANTLRAAAGQAIAPGQACFVAGGAAGLSAGSIYLCDASAPNGATRAKFAGFASSAAAQGATCHIVSNGVIAGFTGLSVGSVYYLDPTTPGGVTATKPTTSGQWSVPVGCAVSTTQLQVLPSSNALALQVTQARSKTGIEVGTAYTQGANSFSAVQKVGYDPSKQAVVPYIYNYTPTSQASLFEVQLTSSSVPQASFGSGTFTVQVTQIPCYGSSRASTTVFQSNTPQAYVGSGQSTYLSFQPSPGQVTLYPDCTYGFSVATSYSSSGGTSIYHNVRLVVDQPA